MNQVAINLADLNGTNGFIINGMSRGNRLGASVSNAGDINSDGIDDFIIGAPGGDESYVVVVFGGSNVGSDGSVELSALDGTNGFVINDGLEDFDSLGSSVSNAGDVNGDGIDDLIVGARSAGNGAVGKSYVVFGGNNVGSGGSLEVSTLNGNNGFVLNGIDEFDYSGSSVSNAGDVNGDGIDDLIIGARDAYSNNNSSFYSGESYVVFGGNNVGSGGSLELSALDGSNGFVLNGIDNNDYSGSSVSNAGDVNGDGIDDLIVGAPGAGSNSNYSTGESYVVFGGNNVGSGGSLELLALDGTNGFVINGIDSRDYSGNSVSNAGDVNGDGIDDLIIGAELADNSEGESYVVFGGSDVGNEGSLELSALDGSNGFVINGIEEFANLGSSVSNAGDVNGDGIDDLVIGANLAEPNGSYYSGESYVIYGGNDLGSNGSLELSALNGNKGFVIDGINAGDRSGGSVSNAGDVNGDGIDDLAIGARYADPNGIREAGESYVIFGGIDILSNFNNVGTIGNDSIEGSLNPDNIFALAGNDTVRGRLGDDNINGGDGNDSLFGNNGRDRIFGDNGNDTLWGQGDNDTIEGGSGNDRILGNNGNDSLNGGNGADTLFGGANNDLIVGGDDNDLIFGQNGDDNLSGGKGLDTLWGGAGSDTFNISRGGNTDRIKDYVDGQDKFALGSNLTFEDLTFVQNGSTTQIRFAQDGFNEFIAAVENTDITDLDVTDFV